MAQAFDKTSARRQLATVTDPHTKPFEDISEAGPDFRHVGSWDGWPVFVRLLLWATRNNRRSGRQP